MKEQWKKLDSDAKLLVNVEEGRSLPFKIELPITAFVSNKDNCCKRLLTILRVSVLVFLLLLLSWIAVILLAYCINGPNLQIDKVSINGDTIYDKNDDSDFNNNNNMIYQAKYDLVPSDSANKLLHRDIAVAEEPGFISKPNDDIFPSVSDDTFSSASDDNQKLAESLKILSDALDVFEKVDNDEEISEWLDSTATENFSPDNVKENNENEVIEVRKNEKEKDDEMVKFLFQLFNAMVFDEQMSVEDVDFTKQNSKEKNEGSVVIPSELSKSVEQQQQPIVKTESTEEIITESPMEIKVIAAVDFASLLVKYLEPIIGDNDEMLVWYYKNKNNPNFETDNDRLKVNTAKLLYSTNIAEYPTDMEIVLNSLLLNDRFVEELKLLSKGELKSSNLEDSNFDQYRSVDRIATKINMNKLIREDPKVIEVFSRMIETNNRLELAQAIVNPDDLLFGEFGVKADKSLFVKNSEEADKQRLLVLEAIRKVANDDVPSPELKLYDDLEDEFEVKTESVERMRNVINAIKNIAIDDDTKDNGVVEFVEETTPDKVIIEQENESNIEKSAETIQESDEEQSSVTADSDSEFPEEVVQMTETAKNEEEIEKSEESEDEYEKQLESLIEKIKSTNENTEENANMNDYLQVYGDFYDY